MFVLMVMHFLVIKNAEVQGTYNPSSFNVACDAESFNATWELEKTNEVFTLESSSFYIALLDSQCSGTVICRQGNCSRREGIVTIEEDEGGTKNIFGIQSNYSECGTTIEEHNADYIYINNTVSLAISSTLRPNGLTIRNNQRYRGYVTCMNARWRNVSPDTNDSYTVSITEGIAKNYNKTESFSVSLSMDFYEDDRFTKKVEQSTLILNVNDNIYVSIQEQGSNEHFKFVVNQCFASTSQAHDDNAATKDVFFDSKCSLDASFEILSQSSDTDRLDFKLQAFSFLAENEAVYFHCQIQICTEDERHEECSQRCVNSGNRWRRDVREGKELVLTSKPVIFNVKRRCNEMKWPCPFNSQCYELQPSVCMCNDGYVFSKMTSSCSRERLVIVKDFHVDAVWNPNYSNTSSTEFRKLSVKYENLLYRLFLATDTTREIEGIKVIRARQGSVILDIKIMYASSSTGQKAFEAFTRSIITTDMRATMVKRNLQVINDRSPSLEYPTVLKYEVNRMKYAIIAVGLLFIVLFSGVIIYQLKRKQRATPKGVIAEFVNKNFEEQ